MSGFSSAFVGKDKLRCDIRLGHFGGDITIGNVFYSVEDARTSKIKIREALNSLSKTDIIDMLLDFIENAEGK